MLTIILLGVTIAAVMGANMFYNPSYTVWQIATVLALDIALVVALNALVALLFGKIVRRSWYQRDSFLYHTPKSECRFYEKIGIKHWKDHVLELGKLNGFQRDQMMSQMSVAYIQRYITENRIGLQIHFWSMLVGNVVIFLCPHDLILTVSLPVALINLLINAMSFAILRYNTPRLAIALRYASRNQLRQTHDADNSIVA